MSHTFRGEAGAPDVEALRDITFEVPRGSVYAIVGRSGFGKSTLLRILGGLLTPTQGEVRFEGGRITGPLPDVGMVFQDYTRSLMPWLTVGQNVRLGISTGSLWRDQMRQEEQLADIIVPRNQRKRQRKETLSAAARAALEVVGLKPFENAYPWQLSGGMQQRVAIARAIARGSEVLLLDEAFGALDQVTKLELEDSLAALKDEIRLTVVLVTHDLDEALYLADRVLMIRPDRTLASLDVPIPRPRKQVDTRNSASFADLRRSLYAEMGLLANVPI